MAECIRLQMDGLPDKAAPMATFVFAAAIEFCARPEVFPAFQRWVAARLAAGDAPASLRQMIAGLNPSIVGGFADFLADGVEP